MMTIKTGEHGIPYGGIHWHAKFAITALEVLKNEKLAENAATMG